MADEPINLVLEHLRYMRGVLDRVEGRIEDLTLRMGNVERSVAQLHVNHAELSVRIDRMDGRLSRIEKRLDLVEA